MWTVAIIFTILFAVVGFFAAACIAGTFENFKWRDTCDSITRVCVIIIFVLLIILVICSLIFDKRDKKYTVCTNCEAKLETGDAYCSKCGTEVSHKCSHCGAKMDVGDAYCTQCGEKKLGKSKSHTDKPSVCSNCSKEISHDDAYCTSCGTKTKQ